MHSVQERSRDSLSILTRQQGFPLRLPSLLFIPGESQDHHLPIMGPINIYMSNGQSTQITIHHNHSLIGPSDLEALDLKTIRLLQIMELLPTLSSHFSFGNSAF